MINCLQILIPQMKNNYSKRKINHTPFEVILKNTSLLKKIFLLLVVLFGTFSGFGQVDNCAATSTLSVGTSCSTTNYTVAATFNNDGPAPCNGTSWRDGWFTFTTDATTTSVTIQGTSDRVLGLALYSGTCGTLSQVACSVLGNANANLTNINVLANTSYLLRLMRTNNANNNSMVGTICVYKSENTVPTTGNNSYSMCSGNLYDNGGSTGNYANSSNGYTVLNPSVAGNFVRVSGTASTEVSYDFIKIYDGVGLGGTVLYNNSGTGLTIPNITSTTGSLTVQFTSDISNADTGFNLAVSCITPSPPTITNLLTNTSGCAGSSITITGTNLTGATAANVKIGGTAVSSITSNDGTTLVAVIGSGTTGTVSVTTPSGTATSLGTFTVNSAPTSPGNPTSNSPQCNPPGATLTSAAAPPGTENYYWQATSLGTSTTNSGNTYTVATSGTYYIRAQTIATGCWSLGQGSLAVVVNTSINTLATIPNPSNGALGVCYAGSNPVSSISWTAAAGATSYDVYFGPGSLPGSVTSTVATTSYATGTLSASTTYYWKIVPKNACGVSTGSPITWSFTTSATNCYCIPTGTTSYWITNFTTTGGVTNIANTTANSNIYGNYTSSSVGQFPGSAINMSITTNSGTHYFYGWVDWNNDGDFADAGEAIFSTSTFTANYTGTYIISAAQPAGSFRMRIANSWSATSITSCSAAGYSEYEDYTLNVLSLSPCATPTAQPTALNLTVIGTTINGAFTAASPAPSGYLIVRSTSATAPSLTNGTTYAVGFTGLTPGTTRVIQGSTITSNGVAFSDTGLTANTQYYYHVFSYNASCIGTPFYLTTTPLTNNATTCIPNPTSPVNSAITSNSFTVTWSASTGALNYVLEVYTNAGYTIPVAGSPFTIASPTVTYNVTGLVGPVTYYYRIKATNASCSSGYSTGTVTTLLSNDEPCNAIPLTVSSTCSYSTYTNAGATASTTVPAPGCGGYLGGDVWFSAVVPATGELDFDLQTGSMTDSGIAIYSGTCGALTQLDCDDDSSTNGLMSSIKITGLTPGNSIYIRVWEYNNDSNGTFGICASTPSCPSPSDIYTNILSATSVTVGWTPSAAATGGYQYYINTTGTAPTAGTTPTGSTPAGVTTVTLTGLTSGLKYYFWVRSFCGGTDVSTWFGPTNYTPCAVGSGTGSTTLGCTSPITGGLGLSGADPAALSCSALTCPTLEVSYLPIKQTTNYTVSSIPFTPPYQFTCLQNPVSVNVDDVWSSTINLPFDFCFYGNNYNKCLIGSNGVITFDTTTYLPGGYNDWSFSSNLPNTSLFRNTIFGVYQDIDPSKGGQVGWELITLNSGCRALVASWNEIPMFSSACNSKYYTGMMVLYENTNIIEVYIKEKNNCGGWNDGNAIVGVQNAAGTAAVVAPGRNGLDANWTVPIPTGEAWRFTPSGPSIIPIVKWYQGPVSPTNLIAGATASTLNVCPTVTTSYTAEVTYPLCTGNLVVTDNTLVTVNGNKVWNGASNNDWNTGSNWTPTGVPTSADCVIVPVVNSSRPYPIVSNSPNAVGYNLAVYNNASLTINSNQNLTITDKVTVQPTGIFTINNSASLIQINNILNSGNIIYKRDSPNIRMLDYSYWSSPVVGFNVSNIVAPLTFGPIYKWNTTVANSNGGQGTWQNAPGSTMVAGKGYIARAPNAAPYNSGSGTLSGTFTGVPQNGIITIPIERGTDQNTAYHTGTNGVEISYLSDNWNLLGNPYPSAIRASQFLFDNKTKIEGNVRLWTHGNLPVYTTNPFYSSFVYNYTAGDYLTYNFTGTSCCPAANADLYIGSGQGFFVQMLDGPPVSATDNITVEFNNGLRSATLSNTTFYRTSNLTTTSALNINNIERNRIWLDLINPNGQSDRTLFGYIQDATMETDSFFDCITQNTGGTLIYSKTGDTKFTIQGRSLPFDINDEVPIGINIPTSGDYTIAIGGLDGLFNQQAVYLKDELLNITHNIKENPYHFTSNTQSGGINNRFKVVYVDNTLGTPTYTLENTVKVMVKEEVAVSSSTLQMESILVYNLLGQELDSYKSINSNYVILSNLHKNTATLLLKIKLQTGEIITKKIIF